MSGFRLASTHETAGPATGTSVPQWSAWLNEGTATAAIRRALPLVRDGGFQVVSYQAKRWDVRGSGRVILGAAVQLQGGSGTLELPIHVTGQVSKWRSSVSGAFREFHGEDDMTSSHVWLSPADPKLPLPLGLANAIFATGPGRATILAHRFARRLTHIPASSRGDAHRVAKQWTGDGAARAVTVLRAVADAARSFRVPRVFSYDPMQGEAAMELLPGHSFYARWAQDESVPVAALGQALRELRTCRIDGLPVWSASDELATIRRFADRVERIGCARGEAIRAAVNRFEASPLRQSASFGPHGPAHRDLHDKQVFCGAGDLAILDWDLAAHAPTALDPANFLAHLTLRALQGRTTVARAQVDRQAFTEAVAAGDSADPTAPSLASLRAWERLALLRLAGVYALRPGSGDLPERLLDAAFLCAEVH